MPTKWPMTNPALVRADDPALAPAPINPRITDRALEEARVPELSRSEQRRVAGIIRRARARADTPVDLPEKVWRRPSEHAVRNARPDNPGDRFVPPVDPEARTRRRWGRT